ncbi:MAG: hypothetical protein ACXVFQ_01540 [Solirubrobacteraceae bacterium]
MKWRRATGVTDRSDALERARSARAARARGRGTLMIVVGLAIIPVVAVISFAIGFRQDRQSGNSSSSSSAPTAVLISVGLVLSGPLLVRGRRLRAKGAEYALEQDERPPIVYLRPFESDRMQVVPSFRSRRRVRVFANTVGLGGARKTYEQRLGAILSDVAPFVTIGDPTETLPRLGAQRLYATDEEWHRTVDDLLARGGTIILHVGDSPGLSWEVERIVALDEPERVILSLPLKADRKQSSREQRFAGFRARCGNDFPRGLPDRAGETQFLYFDSRWDSHRLEEPGGVPSEPAPGNPDEQRALVLRKLAPEFKLMWAPLWVRLSVYVGVPVLVWVLAALL